MKVRIQVEFEIEANGNELSENDAKSAASLTAWNNLVLTNNGQDVTKWVKVHVDGFGPCRVAVGENHE